MKRLVIYFLLGITAFGFSSCLKSDLEDLPEFSNKEITGVNAVEYRYISTEISPASGQPIVKFVTMNQSAIINKDQRTVEITVSKPDNFPAPETDKLSSQALVVIVNVSTAARVFPVNNAPLLGVVGNWSNPNVYRITAADGSSNDWTITVTLI